MKKIWLDPSSHPALKTAALRLSEFYGAAISSSEDQADCLLALNAWKKTPSSGRYFAVFREGRKTIFTGDRPSSMLDGVGISMIGIAFIELRHRTEYAPQE